MKEQKIISQPSTESYREGWERIWGKLPEPKPFSSCHAQYLEFAKGLPKDFDLLRWLAPVVGPILPTEEKK